MISLLEYSAFFQYHMNSDARRKFSVGLKYTSYRFKAPFDLGLSNAPLLMIIRHLLTKEFGFFDFS